MLCIDFFSRELSPPLPPLSLSLALSLFRSFSFSLSLLLFMFLPLSLFIIDAPSLLTPSKTVKAKFWP